MYITDLELRYQLCYIYKSYTNLSFSNTHNRCSDPIHCTYVSKMHQ